MLKGYVISDIHFGCMNSKDLYNQLLKKFLSRVKKEPVDIVVICGDLLDHKLSFNSEASKLCIEFMNKLSLLSKKYKFILRVVKGTKNHDLDQLNNFLYLQKRSDLDFKIINNVFEEEYNGYKILYIPEEYMENPKEYYKEYFEDEYDIAFVHGTFNHVEFASKLIESEKPISNAPVFSYKEFSSFVKGPVLCGHIHIHQNYKNKIYYTGSFSRWRYGEEDPKGYLYFELGEGSKKFKVKFIENSLAEQYITVDLEDIAEMSEDDISKEILKIKEYKEENGIKNLRVNIDKKLFDNLSTDIIKKYFSESEDDDIKVSIRNANTMKKPDEDDNELEETYSFIFNNEYGNDVSGLAKTISEYLRVHDNISLSETTIEELLISEE